MDAVRGRARLGRRTKRLIQRLHAGDVAVIAHRDLDEVAAKSLAAARVAAVVNAEPSLSGRFPARGALVLLEAGIPVLDACGPGVFDALADGDPVELRGAELRRAAVPVARGVRLEAERVRAALRRIESHLDLELDRFLQNTMLHAMREKRWYLGSLELPRLATRIAGRPALVVVRGQGAREDLAAIRPFIREERPVLIGVDGGADLLREQGLRPDLIVGDMDSVTDAALLSGAECVVHAYPDGRAPGRTRLDALGVPCQVLALPGTSEDVAMLLAYEAGAELVVAVGTHTNLVDFLEKGRAGMGSTFLVRAKLGPRLLDAKGVSRLYTVRLRGRHVAAVAASAMVAAGVVLAASPLSRLVFELLTFRLRLVMGG